MIGTHSVLSKLFTEFSLGKSYFLPFSYGSQQIFYESKNWCQVWDWIYSASYSIWVIDFFSPKGEFLRTPWVGSICLSVSLSLCVIVWNCSLPTYDPSRLLVGEGGGGSCEGGAYFCELGKILYFFQKHTNGKQLIPTR